MPPKGRPRATRGRGGTTRGGAQAGQQPTEQTAATDSPAADTPSDTVTPAPQAAASLPSETPAPSSSTTRGTTRTGRFKPKIVRRAEDERNKLAEDYKKIDAAYYREESKATRSRGRGRGRGRGNLLRGVIRSSTALGPLSAGLSFGGGGGGGHGGYGASNFVDNNRINADMLYAAPVEPEKEVKVIGGFEYSKRQALLPMGIKRIEHREEEVTIASTSELEAPGKSTETNQGDEDALFVDQERPAPREPAKDEEVWEHSLPKKRALKDEDLDMMVLDDIPENKANTKASKAPRAKTEDELLADDLSNLVQLFTIDQTDSDKKGVESSILEGHMFLFQFPPVLPPLESSTPTANNVKPDPEDDDDSDIVFAPKKAPVTVDLTEGAEKIKTEDEDEANNDNQDNSAIVKEGGFVGNLVVRKSGKVELSWGGQTLVLAPGTQAQFLSTAVLLDDNGVGDFQGAAFGMGKIQGSFALVPPLDDEQGWDVDPDELVVPAGPDE